MTVSLEHERPNLPVAGEPNRGRRAGTGLLTVPSTVLLVLFFAIPVGILMAYAFFTGTTYSFSASTPLTLHNISDVFTSEVNRKLALNSLLVGGVTGMVVVAISTPIAYWLRYAAGRWERAVLIVVVLAVFASYLVRIYAWRSILGDKGVINQGLIGIGAINKPLDFLLFNKFSLILALVHLMLPLGILMIYSGFKPLEPRYLEVAQDLGAGARLRWKKVILPLVAGPMCSAFLLTFIIASADYATPQFLAGPGDRTYGVQVQSTFKELGNFPAGAALALVAIAAYALLYLVIWLFLRRRRLNQIAWGS